MSIMWDDNRGWVDVRSSIARARRIASGGPAKPPASYDWARPRQPVALDLPTAGTDRRSAAEIAAAVESNPQMSEAERRAAARAWLTATRRETAIEDLLDATDAAEREELRAVRRASMLTKKRRRRLALKKSPPENHPTSGT
jgi:hypothetical protein